MLRGETTRKSESSLSGDKMNTSSAMLLAQFDQKHKGQGAWNYLGPWIQ